MRVGVAIEHHDGDRGVPKVADRNLPALVPGQVPPQAFPQVGAELERHSPDSSARRRNPSDSIVT